MKASDFPQIFELPPGLPVVPPYPARARNLWDLPSSRLCLSDVPRSQTPVDPWEPWLWAPLVLPSALPKASASTVLLITGLNPFTLAYCGPSPPCVRFTDGVTDVSATLGTRALPRLTGLGLSPS